MQIEQIKVEKSSATFSIVNELLINKYRHILIRLITKCKRTER